MKGEASAGVVILDPRGQAVKTFAWGLGHKTNNEAGLVVGCSSRIGKARLKNHFKPTSFWGFSPCHPQDAKMLFNRLYKMQEVS